MLWYRFTIHIHGDDRNTVLRSSERSQATVPYHRPPRTHQGQPRRTLLPAITTTTTIGIHFIRIKATKRLPSATTTTKIGIRFIMAKQGARDAESFAVYRGLLPADGHQAFVFLRYFQNAEVPDHPTHFPLANDSTIPDSQKILYELGYLVEIFKSWLKEYPELKEQLSCQKILAMDKGKVEKIHMEYLHDGLKYESFPRLGAKALAGGKTHYYLQIPISNNGYMYRVVNDADIGLRDLSLHKGRTHPTGIGGYVSLAKDAAAEFLPFLIFACSWFGCNEDDIALKVFYNGEKNRVDVVMERKDEPSRGDKVSLEICFEPGFPVQEFNQTAFCATKEEVAEQERKHAARFS